MIDLNTFAKLIKQNLVNYAPFEKQTDYDKKHKDRNGKRLRDTAIAQNLIVSLPNNSYSFDIGNDMAESVVPQYHILEDAQVITKKGRKRKPNEKKDNYGKIIFREKTHNVYQQYRKNVRGKRSLVGKSTRKITSSNGDLIYINKESKYYENIYYHYIEKTLDTTLPFISQELGLKMKRVSIDTTLDGNRIDGEPYDYIANPINSFIASIGLDDGGYE